MNEYDFSIIKTLRNKLGISAEELAKRADLTRATIAKLEAGAGNPTLDTIGAVGKVFQLTSSEFVRMAEVAHCETATTEILKTEGGEATHTWFPDFEAYHIKAESGFRWEADPRRHENTAEVCLVLSGKIVVTVQGQPHELGPGTALRFKALHEHHVDILDRAEFLMVHHNFA